MVEPVSVSQSYESIARRPNRSSRTTLRINPGACTKSRLSRKPDMSEKSAWFESVKGLLIGVLITAGALYLLIANGGTPRAPARAPESSFLVPVGSEGRLSRGSSSVPVAIDEEMLAELKRAADNNDASGIGPIFIVSDGTTVRVSESGRSGLRVRILRSEERRVG